MPAALPVSVTMPEMVTMPANAYDFSLIYITRHGLIIAAWVREVCESTLLSSQASALACGFYAYDFSRICVGFSGLYSSPTHLESEPFFKILPDSSNKTTRLVFESCWNCFAV